MKQSAPPRLAPYQHNVELTDDFMAFGTRRETVNSEALIGVYY